MSQSPLKLLLEQPTFEVQYIIEEKNATSPQTLYIQGPYMMSESRNKNGRIYTLNEMRVEVQRYSTEMIDNRRAMGELNHPLQVDINPERACHLITKMWQEDNVFYGKSKLLNTPTGNLVKSLILDGVQLGISSRALGKLTPTNDGNIVSNFHLICCDVVSDPSVSSAMLESVLEAKSWIINPDGSITEALDALKLNVQTLPTKNKDEYLKNLFLNFLTNIK